MYRHYNVPPLPMAARKHTEYVLRQIGLLPTDELSHLLDVISDIQQRIPSYFVDWSIIITSIDESLLVTF